MMSLCGCPVVSSLGTSEFSRSLRNSSRLSASPPFLLFLSSSGTSGVRHLVNIYGKVNGKTQGRSLRNESSSVRYAHLQEPGVPQGLSGQREKLLHAAGLLPHHQLLGRRRQVQRGYDVGVIRQLCADCFAVQLLHAVHDQLPLALGLGLLHCNTAQGDTSAQVIGEGLIEIEKYHYCVTCDVNGLQGKGLFFIVHQVGLLCLVCHSW